MAMGPAAPEALAFWGTSGWGTSGAGGGFTSSLYCRNSADEGEYNEMAKITDPRACPVPQLVSDQCLSSNMPDNYIWVVTDEVSALNPETTRDGSREQAYAPNPYSNSPQRVSKGVPAEGLGRVPVPAAKLEQGLKQFLSVMGRALRQGMESAGDVAGMELEEVELSVEINGEGQVSLMGTGVKTGGKGAMTLKFKKKTP